MEFTNLKAAVQEQYVKEILDNKFYIRYGIRENDWKRQKENGKTPETGDAGLKAHLTDTRWEQYQNGKITREQAVEYALARMEKQNAKDMDAELARLDRIANAPDISYIDIAVEWRRSPVWGMNPYVNVSTDYGRDTTGGASGCGYDKESAAVAEALNKNDGVTKVMYAKKEKALADGETRTNREMFGYGSGYGFLPYFEGGVGMSSLTGILKGLGFDVRGQHGKTFDAYHAERARELESETAKEDEVSDELEIAG